MAFSVCVIFLVMLTTASIAEGYSPRGKPVMFKLLQLRFIDNNYRPIDPAVGITDECLN